MDEKGRRKERNISSLECDFSWLDRVHKFIGGFLQCLFLFSSLALSSFSPSPRFYRCQSLAHPMMPLLVDRVDTSCFWSSSGEFEWRNSGSLYDQAVFFFRHARISFIDRYANIGENKKKGRERKGCLDNDDSPTGICVWFISPSLFPLSWAPANIQSPCFSFFLSFFARNLSRLGRKFLSRLFNDSMHSKDRWNVQFVYISARIGLTSIASVEPSEETFQKMYIICFVFSFPLSVRADWCRCRYWIRFRTKTKQSGTRLILGNYVSLPLSVRNAFDWVSWNTLVP